LLTEKDMKKSIAFFTFCAMLFALCGSVDAQQTGKVSRLGYLDGGTASGMATVLLNAFRHELSKLGWIEGKNITIEYRFAEQQLDRLPKLAAELVGQKVDLIVVNSVASASAAKSATISIPIVMAAGSDPRCCGPDR